MIKEGNVVRRQSVLIMDFGGQYAMLIARRVRDLNVYCEIKGCDISADEIKKRDYSGIILSGGANSVYSDSAKVCDREIFEMGIPVLGICYGAQLTAKLLGGVVKRSRVSEYGSTEIRYGANELFDGVESPGICWMSHNDYIEEAPEGFEITASTKDCPVAAAQCRNRKLYILQFHPEVSHTKDGNHMLKNFLYDICGLKGDWEMSSFAEDKIQELRTQIGKKKVICALSGGVDSSVAAVMVHKAIGKNLICIFVDHGLLRKNEAQQVEQVFRNNFNMNLICVDAKERFLAKLAGVSNPESKRKIIGEEFIRVFESESKKLGKVGYLCQGTIYPDVVESGKGQADVIKSHHNVGGLPQNIGFEGIIEPLVSLFKDEVRLLGLELGIPKSLVMRQPFPGPGMALRVIGDITEDKLETVREADFIFREELENSGLHEHISQYFAVLTNISSVGVMGDERTYEKTVALRAVTTSDFMTADWARIPFDVLETASGRIVNEVKGVNRVVYDITSKPPSTIEWE